MRQILELAEVLDITNAAQFTEQLASEFPNGLGKVTAKYVTRYESDAVASAFQIKDGPKRENLQRLATQVMRTFIAARYTSMPQTHSQALLGFAYGSPDTFEFFRQLGAASFVNSHVRVTLPSWFTKGAPRTVELQALHKQVLATLYNIERKFIERLVKLDATIDALSDGTSGVAPEDLNKDILRFISMADDLSFGRANAFFVVFDRLVVEGTGGRSPRNSALVLEITPPNGEKVTKVLTGAKAAADPEITLTRPSGRTLGAAATI
jgi:hypothetical protein